MWKELGLFLQTIFTLARDQQQARDEIKEIRQDMTRLTVAVSQAVNKIALIQQENSSECEKLAMKLEIELLKFEKHLPKAAGKPQAKEISDGTPGTREWDERS